ncbi:sulfurtransferase/chromate resistance protein [Bosea sp. UNC402CLCol]|uniref:chromate resistance protein ChrB domain-containing protein n=1 Tax=Bosea sp. UNC402CLCol TaxID=1510531 RepID=UPI00056E3098|nr:sulfurtransferase/chromate resistance protein [Bosea sp. UNC402CLCol]
MSSNEQITVAQLSRLVGRPDAPAIIDVRIDEDFAADPVFLPTATRRDYRAVADWASDYADQQQVIVVCHRGLKLSEGVAAWLRQAGIAAESLEGGHLAWRQAGGLTVSSARLPPAGPSGGSVWVTRARPKIDRIACPWLIRRFVDRKAVFLFVAATEVEAVAERFGATPFDVEGVFWSHRGPRCTFDVMIEEFGLASPALDRLARIVRAADTATLDAEPQAAGLLAASLGLSRMFKHDLEQLDAGMLLYDAFYRWCRDASEETHNWPSARPVSEPRS